MSGRKRIRINGIRHRAGHPWIENGDYHELRFFYCMICKRDHAYDQEDYGRYYFAGKLVAKHRTGDRVYCIEHYPDADCKMCGYTYEKTELVNGVCLNCIEAKKHGKRIRPFSEVAKERVYYNLP